MDIQKLKAQLSSLSAKENYLPARQQIDNILSFAYSFRAFNWNYIIISKLFEQGLFFFWMQHFILSLIWLQFTLLAPETTELLNY